jgi:VTC domain
MTPWPLDLSSGIDSRETRARATELKFLLSPGVANEVRDWARTWLDADPNGSGSAADEYRTTSLYFDTEAFDVFHRRGSFGRAKYRVRRYGEERVIFLERKLRTSSLLAKRRTSIDLDNLTSLDEPFVSDNWPGAWFHGRLRARRLQPLVQVSYRRMARVAQSEYGPARLTLDDALRAVSIDELGFRADAGHEALPDRVILEMKYRLAMPVMFKQLIEEFSIVPARVSKYRLALEAVRQEAALTAA